MIEDWIHEFISHHMARAARVDFPDATTEDGAEFWRTWQQAFIRKGIDRETANRASHAVAAMGLHWSNEHLPAILKECDAIFKEKFVASKGIAPDSREAAVAATPADCECGRHGIVVRFRHVAVGKGIGHDAVGAVCSCYCTCAVGQWLKSRHDPETRRMFFDLAAHRELQIGTVDWDTVHDNKFRVHPRHWDASAKRPIPVVLMHPEDIRRTRSGGRIVTTPDPEADRYPGPREATPQEAERARVRQAELLGQLPARDLVAIAAAVGDPDDFDGLGVDMNDPPPIGAFDDDDPWFYEG